MSCPVGGLDCTVNNPGDTASLDFSPLESRRSKLPAGRLPAAAGGRSNSLQTRKMLMPAAKACKNAAPPHQAPQKKSADFAVASINPALGLTVYCWAHSAQSIRLIS
jgi:hypothetical protein